MRPRSFAALAVVTVVAVAIAIATYAAQNRWSQAKVSGASLVPGLAAQEGRIAKIELKQGDKTLTLARDKEGWSASRPGRLPGQARGRARATRQAGGGRAGRGQDAQQGSLRAARAGGPRGQGREVAPAAAAR